MDERQLVPNRLDLSSFRAVLPRYPLPHGLESLLEERFGVRYGNEPLLRPQVSMMGDDDGHTTMWRLLRRLASWGLRNRPNPWRKA